MARLITAKTILSYIKKDSDHLFGLRYNMNLYRGCQHGCIYCDSRSSCYQLGELSDIRIKDNALELLEKELSTKRSRDTIGFGSMNDPYMPVEKEYELTRNALKTVSRFNFPVHIITKSDLVIRDMDILKEIGKIYAAVSLTITAGSDELSKKIEPNAPLSSERFKALKELSNTGIYAGITLMPVLPFITESLENLESIFYQAKESKVNYILISLGLTMREGQREYFYNELDNAFPGLRIKYEKLYGDTYSCDIPDIKIKREKIIALAEKLKIPLKMNFYQPDYKKQMSLF